MDNRTMRMRLTVELDEEWASYLTREELADYLKDRLNNSLGFRAEVKKLSLPKNQN